MEQNKKRYKVKDSNKLFYSTDEKFGYITTNNVIALTNTGMKFAEDEMLCSNINSLNNKDIYDKDIVEINGTRYVVHFKDGCFMFCNFLNSTEEFCLHSCEVNEIVVIGNVWENDNLLHIKK